ncbi:MAG: DUF6326 family protein [Candidatus Baltobacteraceae bacterium]
MSKPRADFVDVKVHVKFKLAGLWTSLMFCYVYGDYFGLWQPGTVRGMLQGRMDPFGAVTQNVLLGTSAMLAIPALMVFLSLALMPALNRWLNIVLGVLYTAIMLVTMPGAWEFYIFFGIIEVILTLLIVWNAWRWPAIAPGAPGNRSDPSGLPL